MPIRIDLDVNPGNKTYWIRGSKKMKYIEERKFDKWSDEKILH